MRHLVPWAAAVSGAAALIASCGSNSNAPAGSPDAATFPDAAGSFGSGEDATTVPPPSGGDDASAGEAGVGDGAAPDAAADGGALRPVGGVALGDGGACAHELTNPSCWSAFGTGDLQPKGSFAGGGFDGRYLYLASSGDSTTNDSTRYDTTADFLAASSWSAFNLSSVNTSTASFRGTAFDGRFVYMAPCEAGYSSVLSRYDTTAAFGAAGSWSNFDMSTIDGINPSSDGLCDIGAVFDGRYVYFVPNSIYEYWRGTVARYDPQMAFDSAAAWTTFDTLQLGALAGGFQGAAFDGRYIYFVPWGDTSTGTPLSIQGAPLITRYDTMATFTTMASWATFDPSAVTSSNAFIGAAFDGRYVYFSPGDYRGQALRYDTQASFAAGASWSSFDMTSLGGGAESAFLGARFDGRYVYFIPSGGVLERFDTRGTFGSAASWTRFDLTSLDSRASNFFGGVFDGRYLYLVPQSSGLVFRFDAEPAGSVPAQSNASFF